MTAKTYRQFVSTTAIAATSGVALAIAYMATNQQEDFYLLVTAQFVAVACVVGWILNMFLLTLSALTQSFSHAITMLLLPKSYLAEDGPDWEMVRIRREMIAKRIGANEPVFCNKYDNLCNCSSFCGDSYDATGDQVVLASGYLVSLASNKIEGNGNALFAAESKSTSDNPD